MTKAEKGTSVFLLHWIFVGQPWCPWVRVPLRLITTRAILREAKATRVCTLESGYANAEIRVAQFERHRRTTRQHPRHRGIGFSRSPRQSMRTFFRPSRDATGATVFLLVTLTEAFMATAEPRKVEVMAAIFVWRVRVYEIRATGSAYVMTSENKQNTKGGFAFNKCPRFIGSFAERRAVCEAQNYFTRQAFRDLRQRKATVRSRRRSLSPEPFPHTLRRPLLVIPGTELGASLPRLAVFSGARRDCVPDRKQAARAGDCFDPIFRFPKRNLA